MSYSENCSAPQCCFIITKLAVQGVVKAEPVESDAVRQRPCYGCLARANVRSPDFCLFFLLRHKRKNAKQPGHHSPIRLPNRNSIRFTLYAVPAQVPPTPWPAAGLRPRPSSRPAPRRRGQTGGRLRPAPPPPRRPRPRPRRNRCRRGPRRTRSPPARAGLVWRAVAGAGLRRGGGSPVFTGAHARQWAMATGYLKCRVSDAHTHTPARILNEYEGVPGKPVAFFRTRAPLSINIK